MSLQVWLPLNGNLNNQGLSDVTITNSGAIVDGGGKIGKCYFCSSASYLYTNNFYLNKESFSVAYWVKYATIGSWNTYIVSLNNSTSEDYQFMIGSLGSADDTSSSTNLRINAALSGKIPIPKNEWHHCCATWQDSTVTIYVDGEKDSVFSGVNVNSGATHLNINCRSTSTSGAGYGATGLSDAYVNDIRIYDHCLSAKEVKEISKGLVCHYKLDNNGLGNPNLITTMTPGGRTALNGKYGLNADFSQNLDTYGYFNVSPALELDSTYTLSFDVSNFPVGGAWNFMLWNNHNYDVGSITKDGHYTYTFVPSESKLPSGYNLTKFLFDDGGRTNPAGIVRFTNFKIEKSDKATSWCPHTSDSLYTSLGLNSTMESDCSGLSNNGTKIGGLSSSTSPISIRYESCYDFDGNTGSIRIPNLATLVPSGEFTMNCWIYHDDTWSSEGYETIFGGPSGFELDAKHSGTNSPVLYACDWGKGRATYELNKWNMITMTRNASETKFYINGELKITGSAGTIPSGNYFIGAWKTSNEQNFKGKISDFRLYSTVLSIEDIQELYNVSASVDKNGNMHAYEFKEE